MKKHVLIVTNLYPSESEPNRGIFIKQLVDRFLDFEITVISPRPWRPLGRSSRITTEKHSGINVHYVPHIVIPKILRGTYGWFMEKALNGLIKKIHKEKPVDLISAHWVYPDGYGAVKVANDLGIPVIVHALGCDINEYSKYPSRRKRIKEALKESDQVVVKSRDLEEKVKSLIKDVTPVSVVMNGLDSHKFTPITNPEIKSELGLDPNLKYLLFVGNIQIEKGLIYLLEAINEVKKKEFELLIIGAGPQEQEMKQFVSRNNLNQYVKFLGRKPHSEIPKYLSAVDALCLPSLREGCPNIVLESLGCGTPVLASRVGAVPDIITKDEYGLIVEPESSEQIAQNISTVLGIKASNNIEFSWMSWEENARKIAVLMEKHMGLAS